MLGAASPLLPRLRVRGSVCQMAQQAGRPAARGAQEEIRAAAGGGGGGGRGWGGTVTSKCVLSSAGVSGYVTDVLS